MTNFDYLIGAFDTVLFVVLVWLSWNIFKDAMRYDNGHKDMRMVLFVAITGLSLVHVAAILFDANIVEMTEVWRSIFLVGRGMAVFALLVAFKYPNLK